MDQSAHPGGHGPAERSEELKGRQPAIPPETDAAIAKALDEGEQSAADLARVFRISRSGIYRAAARHRAKVER